MCGLIVAVLFYYMKYVDRMAAPPRDRSAR